MTGGWVRNTPPDENVVHKYLCYCWGGRWVQSEKINETA
jgi:hypothetical protein